MEVFVVSHSNRNFENANTQVEEGRRMPFVHLDALDRLMDVSLMITLLLLFSLSFTNYWGRYLLLNAPLMCASCLYTPISRNVKTTDR